MRAAWLALARMSTLFRVNSGQGWLSGAGKAQRLADGSVLVPSGRPVSLGLALANGKPVLGQADLQGWTTLVITPAMVGCRLAVYTVIETKRTDGGVRSVDQKNFIAQVTVAGGIAGFASSENEAVTIVKNFRPLKA